MKKRDKKSNTSYIFTKETLGMTLMLFSAIVFVILLTGSKVFAGLGSAICTFLYGTFGYGSYFLVMLTAYYAVNLVFEKKIKISFKLALSISLLVFSFFVLMHAVSSRNFSLSGYGNYLGECYKSAANGYSGYTAGGVISGLLVYPIAKIMTFIGAYVIYSLTTIACGYLLFKAIKPQKVKSIRIINESDDLNVKDNDNEDQKPAIPENVYTQPQEVKAEEAEEQYPSEPEKITVYARQPEEDTKDTVQEDKKRIIFKDPAYSAESYKKNLIFDDSSYFNHPIHNEGDYLKSFSSGDTIVKNTYTEMYQDEVLERPAQSSPSNYVYGDKPVDNLAETEPADTYSVHDSQFYTQSTQYVNYLGSSEDAKKAPLQTQPSQTQVEAPKDNVNFEAIERAAQRIEAERKIEEAKKSSLNEEKNQDIFDLPKIERRSFLNVDKKSEPLPPKNDESDSPKQKEEKAEDSYDFGKTKRREFLNSDEDKKEESESGKTSEDVMKFFRDDETSKTADEDLSAYEDDEEESFEDFSRFRGKVTRADFFNDDDDDDLMDDFAEDRPFGDVNENKSNVSDKPAVSVSKSKKEEEKVESKPVEKPKHVWKKYVPPTLDLLDDHPEYSNINTGEIEDNKRLILEALADSKLPDCEVSNVTIGPAITRYDVVIHDKTKFKQALSCKETIAMALMKDNITAFLNYPKGALSIEVPNSKKTIIGLKSIITSQRFINGKANSLTFALGKNIESEVICPDLSTFPHLLVAGTTGSGKSICLNTLLLSLLYKYGPEELRLILVDPKQVEFISYDKLPHLMVNEIICDVDKAIKALNWAISEMERRYELFRTMSQNGKAATNLVEYNSQIGPDEEKLPKILIVLDEFGDLMMQAKKEIEVKIIKLGQKARAAGIHMILATQRPSVDCITGLIKANLPGRIGFKVNSFDDSRTIFDLGGAEKLLGKGDLYFKSPDSSDLQRIQGCFANSSEVKRVTDFVKANNETYFDDGASEYINKVEDKEKPVSDNDESSNEGEPKIDDTYIKALKYCINAKQASVSMIQRRFPIGYIKACKIIDWMELMNYITPPEGAKPRKVLLSLEDFLNLYGDISDD